MRLYATWEYCFKIVERLSQRPGGKWAICADPSNPRLKCIYWSKYAPLGQ